MIHHSQLLTQEFIEQVEDVLPGRARLLPGHLSEVSSALVQVHAVDAFGQQGQHALRKRPQTVSRHPPCDRYVQLTTVVLELLLPFIRQQKMTISTVTEATLYYIILINRLVVN